MVVDKQRAIREIMSAYRISYGELGRHMRQRRDSRNGHLSRRHVFDILNPNGKSTFANWEKQLISALNSVLQERGFQDRITPEMFGACQ